MEAKVLSEAKVYVGTYGKYNNGSLSGAWLDLRIIRQRRVLRSLPGTAQGRGRCGIYVSGLGERAGGLNRRKLDF